MKIKKVLTTLIFGFLAIALVFLLRPVFAQRNGLTLTKTANPEILNLFVGETGRVTYGITVGGLNEGSVNVDDPNLEEHFVFNEDGTKTYTRDFTCTEEGTSLFENTATILEENNNIDLNQTLSDTATVTVNCSNRPIVLEVQSLPPSGFDTNIYVNIYILFTALLTSLLIYRRYIIKEI